MWGVWLAAWAAVALAGGPAAADDPKPGDVTTGPPAELTALRQAVEEAAKRGENVEEIRKQLDAVEKALTGKRWVRPQPVAEPPPAPPAPPAVAGFPAAGRPFPPGRLAVEMPAFPGVAPPVAGIDPAGVLNAQDILRRAQEKLQQNPPDVEGYQQLIAEYQNAVRGAAMGGNRGGVGFGPVMVDGRANPLTARGVGGQIGLTVETIPAFAADQLGLPAGQGMAVTAVAPGSPADKAGVKANDILLELGGKPMTGAAALRTEIKPGAKVDAVVLRKGKKETVKDIDVPAAQPVPRAVPGVGSTSTSVSVTDAGYRITATQNGVRYEINATNDGAKTITVTDGDATHTADTVEKVPEAYRPKVVELLKMVGGKR